MLTAWMSYTIFIFVILAAHSLLERLSGFLLEKYIKNILKKIRSNEEMNKIAGIWHTVVKTFILIIFIEVCIGFVGFALDSTSEEIGTHKTVDDNRTVDDYGFMRIPILVHSILQHLKSQT